MDAVPAPSRVLLPASDAFPSAGDEAAFFASLHQSNGTTRMTSSGRLTDIDAATDAHLPRGDPLLILDIGISSGISTVEWLASLERIGRACEVTAFDRVVFARLYRVGKAQVLAERGGHVLLLHNGRRAITRPVHRTGSWNNRLARTAFRVGDALARLAQGFGAGQQVSLISPQLRARGEARIMEHDIFSPAPDWSGRFHVVRVANLLNRAYFPEERLRLGLRNAADWVRMGGLLVVARTEADGRNHATLFRRGTAGLEAIHRVGSGSEVEALVSADAP